MPVGLRERWARERTASTARGSDAIAAVAARLAGAHSGWDELYESAILSVRPAAGTGFAVATRSPTGSTGIPWFAPATARPDTEAEPAPRH